MRKRIIGFALSAMLLALSFPSEAQQTKKIPLIGYLSTTADQRREAFRAELVRLQVAVIVTASALATKAAMQATTVVPIVVASAGDIVGEGLAASLARPG